MRRARIVIGAAIAAARGRVRFLLGLAAAIFVPLGLLDAVDRRVAETDLAELGELELAAALAEIAAHAASSLLGGILYAGTVAVAVVHTAPGRSPALREVVRETRWLTLIVIDLLFVLGIVLGVLLLLVPGLIFYARYALAATVAELERTGVTGAFRRAGELTRGSRRLVFALLFTVEIVAGAASGAVGQLVESLGGGRFVADWLASAAGGVLFSPPAALLALALALELGARVPARTVPASA